MDVCREIVYHGTGSGNMCVCRRTETPGLKSGRAVDSEKCMKTELRDSEDHYDLNCPHCFGSYIQGKVRWTDSSL